MADQTPAPTSAPEPAGVIPAEWPAQAADAIVDAIGKVRDKTTKPAITAARVLVYGTMAGIVGLVAGIVFLALLVRLWANYVPGDVWILYAVLGLAFLFGGLFVLRWANAGPKTDDA